MPGLVNRSAVIVVTALAWAGIAHGQAFSLELGTLPEPPALEFELEKAMVEGTPLVNAEYPNILESARTADACHSDAHCLSYSVAVSPWGISPVVICAPKIGPACAEWDVKEHLHLHQPSDQQAFVGVPGPGGTELQPNAAENLAFGLLRDFDYAFNVAAASTSPEPLSDSFNRSHRDPVYYGLIVNGRYQPVGGFYDIRNIRLGTSASYSSYHKGGPEGFSGPRIWSYLYLRCLGRSGRHCNSRPTSPYVWTSSQYYFQGGSGQYMSHGVRHHREMSTWHADSNAIVHYQQAYTWKAEGYSGITWQAQGLRNMPEYKCHSRCQFL
jgi:hypothetical protein